MSDPSLECTGDFGAADPAFDDEGDGFASKRLVVELMRVPEPPDYMYVASVRRHLAEARLGALLLLEDAAPPAGGSNGVHRG